MNSLFLTISNPLVSLSVNNLLIVSHVYYVFVVMICYYNHPMILWHDVPLKRDIHILIPLIWYKPRHYNSKLQDRSMKEEGEGEGTRTSQEFKHPDIPGDVVAPLVVTVPVVSMYHPCHSMCLVREWTCRSLIHACGVLERCDAWDIDCQFTVFTSSRFRTITWWNHGWLSKTGHHKSSQQTSAHAAVSWCMVWTSPPHGCHENMAVWNQDSTCDQYGTRIDGHVWLLYVML